MEAHVFIPSDCPRFIVEECVHYGAFTYIVEGLIHDAAKIVAEGARHEGWFNTGTMKEPGRAEGKKTMGLELAEQLGWKAPDVIIYPTGGGSGIIGLWKAFQELQQLGWLNGDPPRLVSVQEEGCHPIVKAFHSGAEVREEKPDPQVKPTGLRVPCPPNGDLIVSILKRSGGTAVAVQREEIAAAQKQMGALGVSASPEGASTLAGLIRLREEGWLNDKDRVVLFNTSHAMKYMPWTYSGASPKIPPLVRQYTDLRGGTRS